MQKRGEGVSTRFGVEADDRHLEVVDLNCATIRSLRLLGCALRTEAKSLMRS